MILKFPLKSMMAAVPAAIMLSVFPATARTVTIPSPDGSLTVNVDCPDGGVPTYSVILDGETAVNPSPLGFRADIGDYADGMTITGDTLHTVRRSYSIKHIKKSGVDKEYTLGLISLRNAKGNPLDLEMMVGYHDIAFRYIIPDCGETRSVRIIDEATSFAIPDGSTAFLSPQSAPMIGWKRTKPSYEERYAVEVPVDTRSQYGRGWTFPCLFHTPGGAWVLLSETGVDSRYCGSRIGDRADGRYKIEFPMPEENNGNGTSEPAFAIPGATPWRTLTVAGTLAPVAETTIAWDVTEPRYETSHDYKSGRGTWSWILWQDGSINAADQRRFIDLAVEMGYEYTLIDNLWDMNIGRKGMEQLAEYARGKGVSIFVWYSSSGSWNDIVQGPVNLMDNPISRKREMKWLRDIGVKGIKVDFFGGDKQETMRLYEQILSDADDAGLMVIFHGCTLPRGWERMYPNYVGSEAVLASENMVFDQWYCDHEPLNATLHPFIRNAVGCMEFGGTFFNRRLNRGNDGGSRRMTGDVFETALSVIFQNPVQNFALAPNNLTDAPGHCLDFMKSVPTEWDDMRLIDGYPGKYVVLARRRGDKWYVAAINATDSSLAVSFTPEALPGVGTKGSTRIEVKLLTDRNIEKSEAKTLNVSLAKPLKAKIIPNGGALWTIPAHDN